MKIRASAPGRCGILGNPSDIYGGAVLSCSIPARATCTLTLGETGLPEDTTLWDAATARFPFENARVEWQSDVPRSSGLAGSTALLAATLACVLKATGQPAPLGTSQERLEFAELVRDIERHEANVVCGYQDATMAVLGGLQLMDFAGKHPVQPGPLPSAEEFQSSLPFLLVTTGVERLSGSVHGPMVDRWLAGDWEVQRTMLRLRELAPLGQQAMIAADWQALGEMMGENHGLIAALGGSGEAIDRLIADCREAGALGAKLAGAGLGGTVIALTEDPENLQARLAAKGYTRFMRPRIMPGLQFEDPLG